MAKVLTDEQQKIQNKITALNGQINEYRRQINGHKNQIELEIKIIDPLEKELNRLIALLNNARDTPNEYDKLKLKIQLKKRELQSCDDNIKKIKVDIIKTNDNVKEIDDSFNSLKKKKENF